MGKSKLAEQSVENITEPSEAPVSVPVKKSSAKKQVINGVATVNVSYNNTLISIGDSKGEVIA